MDMNVYDIAKQVMLHFREQVTGKLVVEEKEDLSLVTRVDVEMERFCMERLSPYFKDSILIGEETSEQTCPTIQDALEHDYLITIDGIDGTWRFVEHYNEGRPNNQWLVCMTCVMQRSKVSPDVYEPILCFALRPSRNELWMFEKGEALLFTEAFTAKEDKHVITLGDSSPLPEGTLDVALNEDDCPLWITNELRDLTVGFGPSGYNMVELALSAVNGTGPNFTMFQYKAWDLGLWPLLLSAGYHFSYVSGESFVGFAPKKFGQQSFDKITDPLIVSLPQHREAISKHISMKERDSDKSQGFVG